MKSNSITLSNSWKSWISKWCDAEPSFWSFFYIWFGFLCAQVSSGNCETMESWKVCNFDPKASEVMLEFQYIECTFVNEVSNLARVRARKGPGCVPILWAASDIYNQTKTPTCSMFFLFYRTFAFFFFSNIKKHKVKVKVARPSLACATDEP